MSPDVLSDRAYTELPLGAWYAEPVAPEQAAAMLERSRAALRQAYFSGQDAFGLRLREMIARFWLGRPVEADHLSLVGTATGVRERALAELVYGQLLMSRKLAGAMERLDAGFALAVPLLAPADYFALLKRHDLLRHLPLSTQPAPAQDLASLLAEAAVIRRLQAAAGPPRRAHSPTDTVG